MKGITLIYFRYTYRYTFHLVLYILFYFISASNEQIYDSFSLPSACVCFYKNPSTLRKGSFTSSRSRSELRLPLCEAGTRLDLPKFKRQERRRQTSSFTSRSREEFTRIPRYQILIKFFSRLMKQHLFQNIVFNIHY